MADGSLLNHPQENVGATITKADLAETLFTRGEGLSRRDAADLVELLFETIKDTVAEGDAVKISGFGNFIVRHKRERPGRNPQNGEDIKISARSVLRFYPSQVLKDRLNE